MEQHEVDGILEETMRAKGSKAAADDSSLLSGPMVLMLLAGIAAAGAFATLFAVWYRSTAPGQTEMLRIALDEYVAGRYDIAKQLADQVSPELETSPENYRAREFLLGASGVQLASQLEDPTSMRLEIAAAVPHLEWLAGTEFPPGRTAEGQRLLGLGQRTLGRYESAIIPLEIAVTEDPTLSRELLLPLAEAKLRAVGVKATRAEEDIDRFLNLPNLPTEAIEQAYLLRARVETKLRDYGRARETLGKIKAESLRDEVDLTMAEAFIEEAKSSVAGYRRLYPDAKAIPLAATEMLGEATAILEDLNHRNEVDFGAAAKYLTGISYRIAGKNEDALGLFAALRQNSKYPTEGIAAGLEEVELLAEMRLFPDALLASRAIVREIGDPTIFDPTWLSLMDLQSRLQGVGQVMRQGGGYAESIEYAKALPPVVASADALEMKAESHRQWGESQRRLAKTGDRDAKVNSRVQFRSAGETFAEVAKLKFTEPEYIDLQWDAISALQAGRAFEDSLILIDPYLRYEERSKLPRGLLAKGRALAAIGRHEEALVPLADCVAEFPRDPLSYEARLLAAVSNAELGRVETAREELDANVTDEWLSPESPVYRDSLFIFGDLLYRNAAQEYLQLTTPSLLNRRLSPGDRPKPEDVSAFQANQMVLESAIIKLEEAEQRDLEYGNVERSRRAAYLAAEAHRLAAFWPGIQAADPESLQSAKNKMNQVRLSELRKANEGFTKLRSELLDEAGQRKEVTSWAQSMLRNCYMGVADTYFEMDEPELAATAYKRAYQEFMNEPLALEALMQQSRCYEKLGRVEEAENIFKQASLILSRIPAEEDPRFARTTRYAREDWAELLQWLQDT